MSMVDAVVGSILVLILIISAVVAVKLVSEIEQGWINSVDNEASVNFVKKGIGGLYKIIDSFIAGSWLALSLMAIVLAYIIPTSPIFMFLSFLVLPLETFIVYWAGKTINMIAQEFPVALSLLPKSAWIARNIVPIFIVTASLIMIAMYYGRRREPSYY